MLRRAEIGDILPRYDLREESEGVAGGGRSGIEMCGVGCCV